LPHITLSSTGNTAHERLLGHNPDVLAKWLALESSFFASPTFDSEFREQVRRSLAFGNECEYCMLKAGRPDVAQPDVRRGLAVAFADVVGRDHRTITASHIAVLRAEFDEAEIAELVAFVSFISASQMLGAMLGLRASDLPQQRA
jgi:alkylhydroperoxidase family enzyme